MTLFRTTAAGPVAMSAQEEADQIAEWAANATAAANARAAEAGAANFKAAIERQAQDLDAKGDGLGALKLRLKHKLL